VIFRVEHRDQRVGHGDVEQRKRPGILADRSFLRERDLLGNRIPCSNVQDGRIKARDVRSIG
jgi:hypothetical protein